MRRLLLMATGLVAAWYALRLGHYRFGPIVAATIPASFPKVFEDIRLQGLLPIFGIAAVAAMGSAVAIVVFLRKLFATKREDTYTEAPGVFWTMLVLAAAAFSFGVFAQPLRFGAQPWRWLGKLDPEWVVLGLAAAAPTGMLLVSLFLEVVARLFGGYNRDQTLSQIKEHLAVLVVEADARRKSQARAGFDWVAWRAGIEASLDQVKTRLDQSRLSEELRAEIRKAVASLPPNVELEAIDRLKAIVDMLTGNEEIDVELVEKVNSLLEVVKPKASFLPPGTLQGTGEGTSNGAAAEQK